MKTLGRYRPISISLSPNTEKDDIHLAFRLLFQPWKWKKGAAIKKLEEEFKNYLGIKYAFSFNSGRSALMAILNALNLEEKSDILAQAFTCNAATNPIIWAGLNPVYVDCDTNTFNIDTRDIQKKITPKSRAIMVQHTFGLPADMENVLKAAKEKNLFLIEDCAHALGAEFNGRKVGTFGKAAFFSFGRDKIISSVYGGMAVTNDDLLAEKIKLFQEGINYPCICWIEQQLLHPILMNWLIMPTYNFLKLGKFLLVIFQKIGILSKAVHSKEKKGKKPCYFPKRLPNGLALLALNQFKKLGKFDKHRQEVANFYYKRLNNSNFELPNNSSNDKHAFLRFTIKNINAHQIIKTAWKENILIGDWYNFPIVPADTNLADLKYQQGSCPTAERLAGMTFNLPTHINISLKDAKEITDFLEVSSS